MDETESRKNLNRKARKDHFSSLLGFLYFVLAVLPIPILLFSIVLLSPNEIPPTEEPQDLVWSLGNEWQLRLEITKLADEEGPEIPTSPSDRNESETLSPLDESYDESYILASSVWTDKEPRIDNHFAFEEWPLTLEIIHVHVSDFNQIEFGAQNNKNHLFLLFIFHWNKLEQGVSLIEAKIAFKTHNLAASDKLVIRFYLEKTSKRFDKTRANIALHMQGGPIDIEIPEEDQLGQVDVEAFREQLYAKIDRNKNDVHDDLDSKISNGSITDWVRTVITCKHGSLTGVRNYLEDAGGQILKVWDPSEGFYGLAANVSVSKIRQLGQYPDIEMIEESQPIRRFADDATRLTQLRTYVWDTLGYTGDNNSSIAIIDTGLDDSHPILNGFGNGSFGNSGYKIVGWYDTVTEEGATTPEDYQGHGSHCGGIAAGLPYNSTVSATDSRLATTWSYTFVGVDVYGNPTTYEDVYLKYYIDVRSAGTIDVSYYWKKIEGGTNPQTEGRFLYLFAPNGTKVDEHVAPGSNPMSVSKDVSEIGLYSVGLGFTVSRRRVGPSYIPGEIALIGVNNYPYEDLNDSHSRVSGVAPDTKLVGIKTFDRSGLGWDSNVITGLNWLINHAEHYHVTIASMSIGFSGTISSVNTQIIMLWNKGVLPAISAGNDGQGAGNQIFSPGEVDYSITVAASGDYNYITDYSSQGPGNCTENSTTTKPDVAAPGGVSNQGAYLQVDSGDSDADNGRETAILTVPDEQLDDLTAIQGTSMATPYVAGIAALLVQAMGGNTTWVYDDTTKIARIKQILMLTAHEIYGNERGIKDNVEGYGRVSADAALEAILYSYNIGNTASASLDAGRFGRKVWARNVTLVNGNTYSFTCNVPEDLDFDVFLYSPSPTIHGEPQLVAKSVSPALGGQESFTYSATATGYYFITVKYAGGSGTGSFTLNSESGTDYPSISLITPAEDASHNGLLTLQVSASVANPPTTTIRSVEVMWAADSWVNITNNYNAPFYEKTINTTQLANGIYGFFAAVVDSDGKTTYTASYNVSISNAFSGDPSVLLVDDDVGASYEVYYEAALDALSISYDYTSTTPSSATMSAYQTVIWLIGDDWQTSLTSTEQTQLSSYLDGGGTIFISGQDIGYYLNASGDTSFLNNYLKAGYVTDDVGNVNGIFGDGQSLSIFEGESYYLGGGDGANNNNYPDGINAQTGGILALAYNDGGHARGGSVIYNGTWKSVYFAFPFESIRSANERTNAMRTILSFLGISVNITSPTSVLTQGSFALEWRGSNNGAISYYHIFQDGNDQGITSQTSMDFDIASDGPHTIRVVAYDSALKRAIDIYSFTVDNTPPTITLNSPENKSSNPGGTTIGISFDGTEVEYYFSWDGQPNFTTTPELPYGLGEHTLDVYARDNVGNWNHQRFVFYTQAVPELPGKIPIGLVFIPFLVLAFSRIRRKESQDR